jgi:hypothetical protein
MVRLRAMDTARWAWPLLLACVLIATAPSPAKPWLTSSPREGGLFVEFARLLSKPATTRCPLELRGVLTLKLKAPLTPQGLRANPMHKMTSSSSSNNSELLSWNASSRNPLRKKSKVHLEVGVKEVRRLTPWV